MFHQAQSKFTSMCKTVSKTIPIFFMKKYNTEDVNFNKFLIQCSKPKSDYEYLLRVKGNFSLFYLTKTNLAKVGYEGFLYVMDVTPVLRRFICFLKQ